VIPTAFEYERAISLDDAVAKLAAAGGAGKLIAGGHSLVPLMKLRLSEPTVLIDIAHIPDLAGIRESAGVIEIGAGARHHDVATSALLRERCPVVADTAAVIGDPQVRNRGTLGGSLAHADPAADYPAAMLAVDADLHLKGPGGWRVVKARDFFQGVFTVDLAADEILVKVTFTPARASAYAKLHQRASRFAIVGVAAALETSGGIIRTARVGLTGAASCPARLANVEAALAGQPATAAAAAAAARGAADGVSELNADIHGSVEYRRAMIPIFTRRALDGALARNCG
jgi:carbon-monoxide dehydrogenase medium subunit